MNKNFNVSFHVEVEVEAIVSASSEEEAKDKAFNWEHNMPYGDCPVGEYYDTTLERDVDDDGVIEWEMTDTRSTPQFLGVELLNETEEVIDEMQEES